MFVHERLPHGWVLSLGFRALSAKGSHMTESTVLDLGFLNQTTPKGEFPKIRGTVFRGPYNEDPII